MSESFDTHMPTPEELSQTYRGCTLDDFRVTSSEEIRELYDDLYRNYNHKLINSLYEDSRDEIEESYWEFTDEATALDQLTYWAKHGVPDRNVTRTEVLDEMAAYVSRRKQADPTYGTLTPEHYAGMDERCINAAKYLLSHVFATRDPVGYVFFDTYTLYNTLDFESDDVDMLVENNVIRPVGEEMLHRGSYELSEDYYDYFLVKDLPTPEDDTK